MESGLAKKLRMQSGQRVIIMNAPDDYMDELGQLPSGVTIETKPEGEFDFVHLFAANQAELASLGPIALRIVKPDGLLWISYPKKSGTIKTDLSRDTGWDVIHDAGFDGISLISINDTWSAMRFRPFDHVKTKRQKPGIPASEKPKPGQDRVIVVPDDLLAALNQSSAAKAQFERLSYTNKKEFVNWITGAKKAETRENRLAKTIDKLEKGLKNPNEKESV